MRSFWSLIPRSISKNKKRVFFMAVGIILSISLIISLSIMIESLKASSYKRSVDDVGGTWDNMFYTRDKNSFEKLIKDPLVNEASISAKLGIYKIPNSKYILQVNGYDKNISDLLNFKLLQGKYPKNNNEIAMEDWVLNSMAKRYKIGDKIKLNLTVGNLKKFNIEKEFILSGIFQYKFNTNQFKDTAIAYVPISYVETILPLREILYEGYLNINSKEPIEKSCNLLSSSYDYRNIEFHVNDLKIFLLHGHKVIDFVSMILYIVISIVASVIIYNIFNMSVTERIREFGMLRAIGASPGEIKILVLGEGLILGCIFIPLGIVIGNFVVKGIIAFISGYKDISEIMSIPKSGIIASFAVGFLAIVMGVYSPARKASKISPMEAINSNNNLQLKGKKLKNSLQKNNIISKSFGFTLNMAYLNLNRNRKRFTTTVISLSISIIMFMVVSYLVNCIDPLKNIKSKMGGDFIISTSEDGSDYGFSDKDIDSIKDIKGIDKIIKVKTQNFLMQVPKDKVTDEGIRFLAKASNSTPEEKSDFENKRYKFNTDVKGFTQEELKGVNGYLLKGEIDEKQLLEKPVVILGQNLNYSNCTKFSIGDNIELNYHVYDDKGSVIKDESRTFTIGALLKEDYTTTDGQGKNVVIVSDKVCEKYLNIKGYQQIKIRLSKDANYDEVEKNLRDKFKKYRGVTLTSYKEQLKRAKKNYLQNSLIMYSFISVVAIVSIINLLNIMSMNILLRKREIGMLRALGLGNDEVKKMIRAEGIFYGITSGVWGTVLGTVLTYIFFLISRKSLAGGMTWSIPVITIIIIFFITVLVCLLAAINASRRVFSSSIVESMRSVE